MAFVRYRYSDDEGSVGDFTDSVTTCPDSSDGECEELSLMQSPEPIIQFQFDDDGAYPWLNTGMEDPDEAVLEQEAPEENAAQVVLAISELMMMKRMTFGQLRLLG